MMARIAGVKFEKDKHGIKRYVRIDLKQHSEAVAPLLKQLGAIETPEEEAYRKKFYADRAKGITGDELFGDVIEYMKSLPWKK